MSEAPWDWPWWGWFFFGMAVQAVGAVFIGYPLTRLLFPGLTRNR